MRTLSAAALMILLSAAPSRSAFEPVPESPWLQGGISSSLFPRSPLALGYNPVSLALLEGPGIAASASRPFGLRRLDRTAVAGSSPVGSFATAGGMLSLSGDDAYTEISADAAFAWRLVPRVAAAAGLSMRSLQISSYGRTTGGFLSASVAWSPTDGIYSTAVVRGVARTGLGSSGDPAGPRSVELALGVVPSENVVIALGAAAQEGVDMEFSLQTAFSPVRTLSLGTGVRTDPTRFWAAVEISLSHLGVQYGYGEHSSLPGTHSIALSWGECGSRPEALRLREDTGNDDAEPVFPLNVNTATEEELILIPGIGPARASAIVSFIRSEGPVRSVSRLEEIPGVGPSLMRTLSEYLVAE